MIIVLSPLMQQQIIDFLEAQSDPSFKFEKKKGIELYFTTDAADAEAAADIAKQRIKSQPTFSPLLIKVRTEEYL
ncbi:hypothetical protein LH991_13955 [Schleiferilactobacillus harbinensis]|jgi:hypothetical protein|uniref:Uncharacterized protein n=3 Tax=Schleiferilactobacillus harbinensis TaxID=304207 RepID=A0A510U169_9LACO|nr:hypothetical protein [Schleiferilactobacillus harbinensis]HAY53247.1 hypothetical protein [Lactobacillus sp.]KRM26525.1 hypothetical protein FC91_GL003066 [Schleiferilactobacillus harbinensis DSM 16991]MBO3091986.1 hypothetical protein [Schleiferilactobacillus harbinensis]MCI1687105.1 hypothetical protein [Schleiferilactobacillus harbinensis]MCI1784310.1 hypothetical protein [Schleiferilactobacillus harbinensis]